MRKMLSAIFALGSFAKGKRRANEKQRRDDLLSMLPKNARCAEVGVWKGDFSTKILQVTKPQILVLVDPWLFVPSFGDRWYGGKKATSQAAMDAIYHSVLERFKGNEAILVVRKSSQDFLSSTEMEFDWIYIDGDHSEEPVYRDLCLSWDRVVAGGLIAGDDYYWKDTDGSLPVKTAVERFVAERSCSVRLLGSQFLIQRI